MSTSIPKERGIDYGKRFILIENNSNTTTQDDSESFGKLPVEINLTILQLLGADDLSSARLVNKRIAGIGRRLSCQNVHVMETTESFRRLLTI